MQFVQGSALLWQRLLALRFFQESDAGLEIAGMLWVIEIKSFGLASAKTAS